MFRFNKVLRDKMDDEGSDLSGDNSGTTQDKDAQAIIDKLSGVNNEEVIELPSDKDKGRVYADKYNSVDDLKKGITELKSTLPQYVIDGMSDTALEQHYVELRKEFSSGDKKDKKHLVDEDEVKDDKADKPSEKISSELWTGLSKSFAEKGGITAEQYSQLEKAGIPEEVVNDYLDGLKSKQVTFTNTVYEIAGGTVDDYNNIKEWAEDGNVDAGLMDAMQGMSYEQIIPIYKGIKAQYDLANNKPVRITGETRVTTGAGYSSQSEYLADVADKRYGKHRVYTEQVDKKFANSKL